MTTKKAAKKAGPKETGAKQAAKKTAKGAKNTTTPHSMPKEGRDPKGGLTAKGREYFAKTEGAHLKPGVQGPADTPEKMVRKGSFLRRHFANPRGPMKDEKGEPTRLALSAHAWGEEVPQTMGDAKKLAAEGHELLEQYHEIKDGESGAASGADKGNAKRGKGKAPAAKQVSASPAKAAKTVAKKSSKKPAKKETAAGKQKA